MAFGGKVDDGAGLVLGQQARNQGAVADVALHEDMAGVALQAGQVVQVARVGKLVEVDNRLVAACEPVEHKIGANEACAAGDQNHGNLRKTPWGESQELSHRLSRGFPEAF